MVLQISDLGKRITGIGKEMCKGRFCFTDGLSFSALTLVNVYQRNAAFEFMRNHLVFGVCPVVNLILVLLCSL